MACSDMVAAVRGQLHAGGMKADAHGNLLQSFRNMDVTTGPAGTPRSTANTGKQLMLCNVCDANASVGTGAVHCESLCMSSA